MNTCRFYMTVLLAAFVVSAISLHARAKSEPISYNHLFEIRNICGWTVYINKQDLLDHPDEMDAADSPDKLKTTPIWLELEDNAVPYIAYHCCKNMLKAKGLNPDKLNAIEIGSSRNFQRWQEFQKFILLRYLAYAYYDKYLHDQKKQIDSAYTKTLNSGKYTSVLRFDGKKVRHPALNSAKEYFASITESYYGLSDHYPFIQFELRQYDPNTCDLLTQLWGGKAK